MSIDTDNGKISFKGHWALIILVVVWPFLYYYRSVIPNQPFSLALGNDFDILYYNYKVYLLDLLSSGRFPLWSPSEAAGFPFYSSPFTQAFYPLNAALMWFYRIMGGYSAFDHQFFTIAALSIYALGLFLWLRLLEANARAVVFGVLTIAISFKLGEILRFPNAAHAAAWIPWILYGVTLSALPRGRLMGALTVFMSCLMLVTAGYPYYIYYCLFLVPPYLALLSLAGTRRALGLKIDLLGGDVRRMILCAGFAAAAALVLCGPYLYKMAQLMGQTVDRASASYHYATLHEFSVLDTVGSLIFPPAAMAEGWYYFGTLGFIVICLWAAAGARLSEDRRSTATFLVIVALWWLVVTYITYGKRSYLFDLLWNVLPGFDRLRAWPRLNIILLPIIGLCLAKAYAFLEGILTDHDDTRRRERSNYLLKALIAICAVVASIQAAFLCTGYHNFYWDLHFKRADPYMVYFPVCAGAAFLLLAALTLYARRRPVKSGLTLAMALTAMIGVGVADMRPVGSIQWQSPASAEAGVRKRLDMRAAMFQSLSKPRALREDSTIAFSDRFNIGFLENWYFDRYLKFYHTVFAEQGFGVVKNQAELGPFKTLMGLRDGRRFFFSRTVDSRDVATFMEEAASAEKGMSPELTVLSYDGDSLLLDVVLKEPAYLSFIDNWDPDWIAEVNGKPASLEKVLGSFKAVRLPTGPSRVLMEYRPF